MEAAEDETDTGESKREKPLQKENLGLKYPHFMSGSNQERPLFSSFREDITFAELHDEARRLISCITDPETLTEFQRRFAGAVYEAMTYSFLAGYLDNGYVLNSPTETFGFFHKLYPEAKTVMHPFGSMALEHIPVFDGVLKKRGMVFSICEYTLSNSMEFFLRSCQSYDRLRNKFPDVFRISKLSFAVPQYTSIPLQLRNRKDVEFIEMPFSRNEFRQFIDCLTAEFEPISG